MTGSGRVEYNSALMPLVDDQEAAALRAMRRAAVSFLVVSGFAHGYSAFPDHD